MSGRGVLRIIQGDQLGFWCPGCKEMHVISVGTGARPGWTFDGNYDKPTFSPSVLVTSGHYSPGWTGPECWCTYNKEHPEDICFECERCHSFVKGGNIEFLGDCTHALAAKTVPLREFPQ